MMNNDAVVSFEKLRRDDHVGNARFIFEAQEDKSFGSTRPLADNHGASHRHKFAVRQLFQMSSRRDSSLLEL